MLIRRRWFSIALLAVVVPISLLAAFKLAGIIPEPLLAETITIEAVSWKIDRPFKYIVVNVNTGWDNVIETNYTDETVLIEICVPYASFWIKHGFSPFFGEDGLVFRAWINTTTLSGFVRSITVQFQTDNQSIKEISKQFLETYNATVTRAKYWTIDSTETTFVHAEVSGSPSNLKLMFEWVFSEDLGKAHQALLTAEILHFNGTSYRKIILPLQFDVIPDVGNSFETARLVSAGEYVGCLDTMDTVDMYAFYLEEGWTINITMVPPEDANFNLHLYDQRGAELANSTRGENQTETITYTAETTETYYIRMKLVDWLRHNMEGAYKLEIEVLEAGP